MRYVVLVVEIVGKKEEEVSIDVLSPPDIQFFTLQSTEDVVLTADISRVFTTCKQFVLHAE